MAAGHARGDARRCDDRIGIAACLVEAMRRYVASPTATAAVNGHPGIGAVRHPSGAYGDLDTGLSSGQGDRGRLRGPGEYRAWTRRPSTRRGRRLSRLSLRCCSCTGHGTGRMLASALRRPACRCRVRRPRGRPGGRGRGPERAGLRWTRVHDYIDEVAAAVEAMDAPPVIVDHSMGALVVRRILACDLLRVAGAVLVAPVPRGGVAPLAAKVLTVDPSAVLRAHATMSLWPAVSSQGRTRRMFFRAATPQGTVDDTFRRLRDESFRASLDMLVRRSAGPTPGCTGHGPRGRG